MTKTIKGEATTPEQVAVDNETIETKWTMSSTNKGISVATLEKATPIDDILHGAIGRSVHNYWEQVKGNLPEGATEEQVAEELKKNLYFKLKTFMFLVFKGTFGDFNEMEFNKEVNKIEEEALKSISKEEKKPTKKKPTKKSTKKTL